jgi:hypothetical protein
MAEVKAVQKELLGQSALAAAVVEQAAEERTLLFHKLEETGKVVAQLRLEAMGVELELESSSIDFDGCERSRSRCRRSSCEHRPPWGSGPSLQDSSANHCHDTGHGERSNQPMSKLNFPKFAGEDPVIWHDKCVDYFTFFKVPESMWVTVASLHMEGNVTRWLQVYKLKKNLGTWTQFGQAVKSKFGVDEYPKVLRALMNLRQKEGWMNILLSLIKLDIVLLFTILI